MKRKLVTALVTAALPAIFVGATATPALADCPSNTFCLYETAGYQDGEYRYTPGTSCTNLGSGINNDANSMRNYRSYNIRLWDLPGCGGATTYLARAFSYDSDFGNNGFSNKASSLKRV
ncbi:peptidase inhibitor family I36 protein [Allorhizocola rhizosphaerae]|uniref:peptidase inhibitor family I36 protein n=1 Tax=Allorhizocola rhizosphaerae TaxID=1872709 RepID=UPI0013C30EC1|nr:peptidase inhibitor family I36 protein [Allorhizocola rhizosphaerae]